MHCRSIIGNLNLKMNVTVLSVAILNSAICIVAIDNWLKYLFAYI